MNREGVQLSWLERVPDKDEVLGSNPSTPTIYQVVDTDRSVKIHDFIKQSEYSEVD